MVFHHRHTNTLNIIWLDSASLYKNAVFIKIVLDRLPVVNKIALSTVDIPKDPVYEMLLAVLVVQLLQRLFRYTRRHHEFQEQHRSGNQTLQGFRPCRGDVPICLSPPPENITIILFY